MVNLLESAGFSRANPYYVVQQGKVCRLPVPAGFRVQCQQGALGEAGGLHRMQVSPVWPAVPVQECVWPSCRTNKARLSTLHTLVFAG